MVAVEYRPGVITEKHSVHHVSSHTRRMYEIKIESVQRFREQRKLISAHAALVDLREYAAHEALPKEDLSRFEAKLTREGFSSKFLGRRAAQ